MRKLSLTVLAGLATVLAAGTAYAAARDHVLNVSLPDGSVARIAYQGDVAPRVVVQPVAAAIDDPFVQMDSIFAAMAAEHEAMFRQAAAMERALAEMPVTRAPITKAVAGKRVSVPQGFSYVRVVSTTGADGCTQTVEWRSDGSQAQPQVTRASSGTCDAAKPSLTAHPAAEVQAPAEPAPAHKA